MLGLDLGGVKLKSCEVVGPSSASGSVLVPTLASPGGGGRGITFGGLGISQGRSGSSPGEPKCCNI